MLYYLYSKKVVIHKYYWYAYDKIILVSKYISFININVHDKNYNVEISFGKNKPHKDRMSL